MRLSLRIGPFTVSEHVGSRRPRRNPGPGFIWLVIFVALLVTVIAEVAR
jgi:hypothetical protein